MLRRNDLPPPTNDYIDQVRVGERDERPVVLINDHDRFKGRYERELATLSAALGELITTIDHVGSTAVPDLPAKPIVDITITTASVSVELFTSRLESIGYRLRIREPEFGHLMYRSKDDDVNLHIWTSNSHERDRYLAFRDFMRANADARSRYTELKLRVIGDAIDYEQYAIAKSKLIESLINESFVWAKRTGWIAEEQPEDT